MKRRLKSWFRKYWPYCLLVLAIMFPLLAPGYILTLDMVFTPDLWLPEHINNSYLFYVFMFVLNLFLPNDLAQKFMLITILMLVAIGAHKLFTWILKRVQDDRKSDYLKFVPYIAGFFAVVNPFVYSRFMAGQYLVLFGYALLPWFVRALIKFIRNPGLKTALALAAWTVALSIVSIHFLGIAALVAVVAVAGYAWQHRKSKRRIFTILKYGLLSAGIIVLACSYWLLPTVLGYSSTAATVRNFTPVDDAAFTTLGGNALGQIANVLRLQGFWAEETGMYFLPQQVIPAWGLVAIAIWLLVGAGAVYLWKRDRFTAAVLGGSALAATILAAGIFNDWPAKFIPFFAGYREPQKFAGLVALAFAVFFAFGSFALIKRSKHPTLYICIVLMLPLLLTPTMLWGFGGQLKASQYPDDWHHINNEHLVYDPDSKTLFLPWHQYMYFDFAGRIIANPAEKFFVGDTITSDDPEFKGVRPANSDPEKRAIEKIIKAKEHQNVGSQFAKYNIQYIILAKETDWEDYAWLDKQGDIKLIEESKTLKFYQVTSR